MEMGLKLIHAIAELSMPKLKGVIQIDETFVRESQKGTRNLKSFLKGEERTSRYGKVPSKYGITGAEFATITTAIDNKGYSVYMASDLGRLSDDIFYDLFNDYLDNPIFICTDANKVYSKYSGMFNIPHYIKPSLKKNGYYNTEDIEKKVIIDLKLYNNKMIDYIENRGKITYKEFKKLKEMNKLSLSRVNQLHNEIKKFINIDKTNVSTKFLNDYIKFFNYIRNWKIKNEHYPSSQRDVESIFEEILTKKVNYTINDIKNK